MSKLSQQTGINCQKKLARTSFSKTNVRKTGQRLKKTPDPYTTPQHSPDTSSLRSKEDYLHKPAFSKRKNTSSIDNCDPLGGQVTSVGSPIDTRTNEVPTTKIQNRLRTKTRKVKMYWDRVSLMIPNVFRMNLMCREEREILEFNDLSFKGILVMNPLYKNNHDRTQVMREGSKVGKGRRRGERGAKG